MDSEIDLVLGSGDAGVLSGVLRGHQGREPSEPPAFQLLLDIVLQSEETGPCSPVPDSKVLLLQKPQESVENPAGHCLGLSLSFFDHILEKLQETSFIL